MKSFTCYFHYLGLWYWQLGMHLFLPGPNFELHIPFGFFKIGWEDPYGVFREKVRTIGYLDGKWKIRKFDPVIGEWM